MRKRYGSASLTVIGDKPRIKGMWLRSPGWEFDSLSALWREVSTGAFTTNEGSNEIDTGGRNGASILLEGTLAPGASRTYPILITWHFPNCYLQVGGVVAGSAPDNKSARGCRTYARWARLLHGGRITPSIWKDAREVAALRLGELFVSAITHGRVQRSTVLVDSAAVCSRRRLRKSGHPQVSNCVAT